MTTRPATTLRSTSGAGFDFEDHVSAWLQLKMLTGEPFPGVGGTGFQIQAQVAAAGWQIDDLLVQATFSGALKRMAISAKGNFQVTSDGLPADFSSRAWAQWRDEQGPMQRQSDSLALATRGNLPTFSPHWAEIKNACSGSDATLAIQRIRSNRRQSKIFDSVNTPNGVPLGTDAEAVELIRHLHVIPLDFQLVPSSDENQALQQCRQLLESGELSEAEELWKRLISIAGDIRTRRGTITHQELVVQLRPTFRLRRHPDFVRDWETLSNITADNKARVETQLSSGYVVTRDEDQTLLARTTASDFVTVVVGDSGAGNSSHFAQINFKSLYQPALIRIPLPTP